MDKFGRYLQYTSDLILFLLLAVVWKPVAVLLIYCEVAVFLVYQLCRAIFFELLYMWPFFIFATYFTQPSVLMCSFFLILILLHKVLIFGTSKRNNWKDVKECLSIFSSTTLLSRFATTGLLSAKSENNTDGDSGRESYQERMYHTIMEKSSIFYRIARHFL